MAVKIKLKRVGKTRQPYYRIVVADARTARGGRAIEEIGLYRPKEDPSFMQVDAERVSYWLSVGAQPTDSVTAILKVTGDWQKFKGEPAPEPMKVRAPKADKQAAFEAAAKEAADEPTGEATTAKAKKAPKQAPKQAAVADTTAAAADSADAEPEKPAEVDGEEQAAAAAETAEGGADTPTAASDDKPAEA